VSAGLVSVGYAGRTVDELIERLHDAGVTRLIDVRLNPASRQSGFSKKSLAAALEAAGITYVHERDLGNPKENRAAFARGDDDAHERLRQRFDDVGADALQRLITAAADERVAVLCLERSPEHCHRQLVIDLAREQAPDLDLVEIP